MDDQRAYMLPFLKYCGMQTLLQPRVPALLVTQTFTQHVSSLGSTNTAKVKGIIFTLNVPPGQDRLKYEHVCRDIPNPAPAKYDMGEHCEVDFGGVPPNQPGQPAQEALCKVVWLMYGSPNQALELDCPTMNRSIMDRLALFYSVAPGKLDVYEVIDMTPMQIAEHIMQLVNDISSLSSYPMMASGIYAMHALYSSTYLPTFGGTLAPVFFMADIATTLVAERATWYALPKEIGLCSDPSNNGRVKLLLINPLLDVSDAIPALPQPFREQHILTRYEVDSVAALTTKLLRGRDNINILLGTLATNIPNMHTRVLGFAAPACTLPSILVEKIKVQLGYASPQSLADLLGVADVAEQSDFDELVEAIQVTPPAAAPPAATPPAAAMPMSPPAPRVALARRDQSGIAMPVARAAPHARQYARYTSAVQQGVANDGAGPSNAASLVPQRQPPRPRTPTALEYMASGEALSPDVLDSLRMMPQFKRAKSTPREDSETIDLSQTDEPQHEDSEVLDLTQE